MSQRHCLGVGEDLGVGPSKKCNMGYMLHK